ncbi:MAG: hypothetical protein CMF01_09740 [Hyphomonas sp.]|nr:hypothetical protein [Hyphomonas sp.]
MLSLWALMLVGGVVSAPAVSAQELVYTPVNPSFGGNPFNSSHWSAPAKVVHYLS